MHLRRGNLPQMQTSKANLHVLQHLQMIGVEAPGEEVFMSHLYLEAAEKLMLDQNAYVCGHCKNREVNAQHAECGRF